MSNKLKFSPQNERRSVRNSTDSESLTSVFFPWQKHRAPPSFYHAQTGRTVSASEFYLFYAAIMLLISGLGEATISIWFILHKLPFKLLVDASPELAYFTVPNALLCLPCFWIVVAVHNDGKFRKYLPLVLILLTFSTVLMMTGVYIGTTHKLHVKTKQIPRSVSLLHEFRTSMRESLKLSKTNKKHEKLWDEIQKDYKCCGVDNYTEWFMDGKIIPSSCCYYKATYCHANSTSSSGCLKIITAALALQTYLFNGINCVALFIQCFTFVVVASIYFCGAKNHQQE